MRTIDTTYLFKLRESTKFRGQFSQPSIKIRPEALNGTPVEIAVADIRRIHRVDDPGWKISAKLKHFIFELQDDTSISGKPVDRTCLVNSQMFKQCKVEFDNVLEVEKIG